MSFLYRYVNPDGSFDLSAALHERCADRIGKPSFKRAMDFIDEMEELSPIHHLESAAIAFNCAANIARS